MTHVTQNPSSLQMIMLDNSGIQMKNMVSDVVLPQMYAGGDILAEPKVWHTLKLLNFVHEKDEPFVQGINF